MQDGFQFTDAQRAEIVRLFELAGALHEGADAAVGGKIQQETGTCVEGGGPKGKAPAPDISLSPRSCMGTVVLLEWR